MQAGSFSVKAAMLSGRIRRRLITAPELSRPATLQLFLPRSIPRTAMSIDQAPSLPVAPRQPMLPRWRGGASHNALKPHLNDQWVIPPDANAAFVAAMEDVIEVYHRPRDPERPLVCVDETSKQLIVETRTPIPAKPGRPKRVDYEYEGNGTANLFMMLEPLEGWREVKVTDQRAAVDYAQMLKELSDTHFQQASKIVLVQDNLSTHKPASLYEAFPAKEARRLVERFEWHYTPKHGSWLDMAESELSVLSRQCLDRRIPDKQALIEEVAAWENGR